MIIRRIRKTDHIELSSFCERDTYWEKYFPDHKSWLKKALNSKDRVVYGAFEDIHEEGDDSTRKLVACIFLKLSKYDNTIEFKNIILPEYSLENNNSGVNIAKVLIENAIRFCEVRNILKIGIELPQAENNLISLFLNLNFKIVSLRSRYGRDNSVCTLERSTGETYHGDPYDLNKISYWLLRSYLDCDVLAKESIGDLVNIKFRCKPFTKTFSKINALGNEKLVNGVMWILVENNDSNNEDTDEDDIEFIFSQAPHHLNLVLANYNLSEEIKLKLRSRGFIYFERDDLLAIAGTSESSLNTPILPHDIGGMITVLEQEEFLDYAKKQSLTYYLLSGLHDGLNLCTEDDEDDKPVPLVIAYYCPAWENKKSGIIGYSVITEIERPLFKSILERELPEDSALSREDLLLYQTYSKDERIGELKLSKIFMFPSPLPISSNKWVSSTILADHLIGMIKTNGCNSAYLDIDSVRNILNQKGSYYSLPTVKEDDILPISKRNFKVALTFANDHRPLAKEVAEILTHHLGTNSVFYDDYYKSELAQVGLNEVLGKIYRRQSKLIVPLLSKNYKNRKWCNLEWRYISDMLFDSRLKKKLMPLKLDNSKIPNLLEQDGYVDISEYTPLEIAQTILKRLSTMK